jgi:hypothetical protein
MSDSRLDLFNRRLKEQSARLRSRAVELIPKGLRTPKVGATSMEYDDAEGESAESRNRGRQDVEREVDRIKVKVSFHSPRHSEEKLMLSLPLRSHICHHRGDQPRLSGQERKSVCHPPPRCCVD